MAMGMGKVCVYYSVHLTKEWKALVHECLCQG
jgi:hypothetical protein